MSIDTLEIVEITGNSTGLAAGTKPAVDILAGNKAVQYVKLLDATEGSETPVTPLTDAALRASAVAVTDSGLASVVSAIEAIPAAPTTVAVSALPSGLASASGQAAIIAAIEAIPAAPSTVSVSNLPATQAVSAAALPLPTGASTETTAAGILAKMIAAPATEAKQDTANTSLSAIDTKLGAPLHVIVDSGVTTGLTDAQLRNSAIAVSGPATDTQLRATPLPVSGTVAVTGVATETTLATLNTKTPALGQALAAASVPVILPAATITTLTPPAAITGFATAALQGALTETAPASDTASSGLNGRLQRIAQRLTSLITIFTNPASSATTNPSCATSAFTILAANASRKGCVITGKGAASTYVLLGSGTPTATNYTVVLANDDSLTLEPNEYSGIIRGLSTAVSGSFMVTETT